MLKNNGQYYYKDHEMYFWFDDIYSQKYNLFIENKNDLIFDNDIGASSEYNAAAYQEGTYYMGTKRNQKPIKRKCAAEGLTLSQYKEMMEWLTPGRAGFLVFDSNPYWGWTVVIDKIGNANRWGGMYNLAVEFEITFKTIGDYRAKNRYDAYYSTGDFVRNEKFDIKIIASSDSPVEPKETDWTQRRDEVGKYYKCELDTTPHMYTYCTNRTLKNTKNTEEVKKAAFPNYAYNNSERVILRTNTYNINYGVNYIFDRPVCFYGNISNTEIKDVNSYFIIHNIKKLINIGFRETKQPYSEPPDEYGKSYTGSWVFKFNFYWQYETWDGKIGYIPWQEQIGYKNGQNGDKYPFASSTMLGIIWTPSIRCYASEDELKNGPIVCTGQAYTPTNLILPQAVQTTMGNEYGIPVLISFPPEYSIQQSNIIKHVFAINNICNQHQFFELKNIAENSSTALDYQLLIKYNNKIYSDIKISTKNGQGQNEEDAPFHGGVISYNSANGFVLYNNELIEQNFHYVHNVQNNGLIKLKSIAPKSLILEQINIDQDKMKCSVQIKNWNTQINDFICFSRVINPCQSPYGGEYGNIIYPQQYETLIYYNKQFLLDNNINIDTCPYFEIGIDWTSNDPKYTITFSDSQIDNSKNWDVYIGKSHILSVESEFSNFSLNNIPTPYMYNIYQIKSYNNL